MEMTQEEAKKKWCPMARCGDAPGCNRSGADFRAAPFCLGSDCTAWTPTRTLYRRADGRLYDRRCEDDNLPVALGRCGLTHV